MGVSRRPLLCPVLSLFLLDYEEGVGVPRGRQLVISWRVSISVLQEPVHSWVYPQPLIQGLLRGGAQ